MSGASASGAAPRGFRQPRCSGCGLTTAACVCALFGKLESRVAISVVMSGAEARSASNSARLLSLWLPGVELHVRGGEADARARAEHLPEAGRRVALPEPLLARPGTALLFPGGGRAAPLPSGVRHLIVPDGTWAQARRIERRWFARHGLPRVELGGPWPSLYELRRARQGVCTFEATAIALGLLDQPALAEALLARFACWAARARRLKAGGGDPAAERASAHPAAPLLRRLPPGSADAALALASGAEPTDH
ncbi:MAG TPA: tRNA-uridine aminocarboxypropyltransferase [Polyangiaceae bacterium]|nr:tRNA-uridine aminocarboxypropyltransferase [Polyangiaceae bacterium]